VFFHVVYKSGQIFLPFATIRACDRQTDGRTDGQTDRILIARPRLHSMQRGNKNVRCADDKPLFWQQTRQKDYRLATSYSGHSGDRKRDEWIAVCVTVMVMKKPINSLYSTTVTTMFFQG